MYLLLVVVSVLIILYTIYTYREYCPVSQFKNKKCIKQFHTLSSLFGPPSICFNIEGGFCVWFVKGDIKGYPVQAIILKDLPKQSIFTILYTDRDISSLINSNSYFDNKQFEYVVKGETLDDCMSSLRSIDREYFVKRENIGQTFYGETIKPIPVQP